ncbi:MAG: LysM peptidoglycan-binding domain-containing protein [Lentimonas sp.]
MQCLLRTFAPTILLIVLFTGCAPSRLEIVSETDEKQYQLAQDYKTQGRMEEALNAYHRVIDARRDAPESHLEAGYIYLRELKDPVRAIYHFDRYLQFKPNSPQATQVRQLIETAQKEFARQLPAQPYQGELDRIDLMELVKNLKQENDSLKRDLVNAEARVKQLESLVGAGRRSAPVETTTVVPSSNRQLVSTVRVQPPVATTHTPDPARVPRTHTVQPGDTLSTISSRYYGTPSRWNDIFQANRDGLRNENALKVGQVIRIP